MKFIDAHIHLSDQEYAPHIDEIVKEAKESHVAVLLSNSMDLKTCIGSMELAEKFQGLVYAALGIHPWTVSELTEDQFQEITEFILKHRENKALIAIGEIGLDFKYMKIWDKQLRVFDSMLHMAEKLVLPVIIHSRGTTIQIIDMLPSYNVKKVLLHWFSSPISALTTVAQRGYLITEGAPVLYSNGIRDVVKNIPLTNLLTETDGPVRFFRPPFDGKRTSPSFLPLIVNAIAEVKGISAETVADQMITNFEGFFGVKS